MGDRGGRRVAFLGVLIVSLLVTLIGRLYYVQVLDKNPPS
jgi:cell division protein FtsI/penicillin-binding protein 2